MPILKRDLYERLCTLNKEYLTVKNITVDDNYSDIDLGPEAPQIINELKRNEKSKLEICDKRYQCEKNRIRNIVLFLSATVALLGGVFALVSFFMIAMPILPFLLLSFSFVGVIELVLNYNLSRDLAHIFHARRTLDQLNKLEINISPEDREAIGENILTIHNQIKKVHDKIDSLEVQETKTAQNISQILAKLGTFSMPSTPISNTEPANEESPEEFPHRENAPSL